MTIKIKTSKIKALTGERNNHSNIRYVATNDGYKNLMHPTLKVYPGSGHEVYTKNDSKAENIIVRDGLQIDNDLIISAGWGDNFAIYKLNNDGTMNEVYYNSNPTGNSYHYFSSLAVDNQRHVAYVSNWVYDYVARFDYSDLFITGYDSGSIVHTVMTAASHGLPDDKVGYEYRNGLQMVGDYLYISSYVIPSNGYVFRWHVDSESADNVQISNANAAYDAYRGQWTYIEEQDRLFHQSAYNSEIVVIINASNPTNHPTAPAQAFNINTISSGLADDIYQQGIVWCEEEDENIYWVAGEHRIAKIDISPVLASGTSAPANPTILIGPIYYGASSIFYAAHSYMGFRDYGKFYGLSQGKYIKLLSGGGWSEESGFIDLENGYPIACSQLSKGIFSNDQYYTNYVGVITPAYSENGTKYFVWYGYWHDGGRVRIFNSESRFTYEESAYIEMGPYQLDDSSNINIIKISGFSDAIHEPVGSSIVFKVSNNGTDWTNIDIDGVVELSTTGNEAYIRIEMTGNEFRPPYLISKYDFLITYGYIHNINLNSNIKLFKHKKW